MFTEILNELKKPVVIAGIIATMVAGAGGLFIYHKFVK